MSRVKATWSGEGEPKGGVYEYGYGTANPDIPQGVISQQGEPDSNWTFEYIPDDNKNFKLYKYLALPVWFYSVDGKDYYTSHKDVIPENAANVEQGTYQDAYRLKAQRVSNPLKKDPLDDAEDNPKLEKQRATLRRLALLSLEVPSGNRESLLLKLVPGGANTAVNLYLYALHTGNNTLEFKLEKWSMNPKAGLSLRTEELFYNNEPLQQAMQREPLGPLVGEILNAKNTKDLMSRMAHVFSHAQQKAAGEATSSFGAIPVVPTMSKPLPDALVTKDDKELSVAPLPKTETPVETAEKTIDFVPQEYQDTGLATEFASKYSVMGLQDGGQYLARISDLDLNEAFAFLKPEAKKILAESLPGVFSIRGQGPGVRPSGPDRHYRSGIKHTSDSLLQFMSALGQLEVNLEKLKPEFNLTNEPGTYSPLVTLGFPFMWALGSESERVFSAVQSAFFAALTNEMQRFDQIDGKGQHSDLISEVTGRNSPSMVKNIPLLEVNTGVISSALDKLWGYTQTPDGKPSSLQQAIELISFKTGKTEEEVVNEMKRTLMHNMSDLKGLNGKLSVSAGTVDGVGHFLDFGGRAMGMAVAAHVQSTEHDKLSGHNSLTNVAHKQFSKVVEILLGSRLEMSIGDNMTYYPSTEGAKPIQISLGIWQTMHNFLPYHIDTNGDLIVDVLGETFNLSQADAATKNKVTDALMFRISELTDPKKTAGLGSDDAILNSLKKYQSGLETTYPNEFAENAGSHKDYGKVDPEDDIHNDSEAMDQVVSAVGSLVNFIGTDLNNWFRGQAPSNLSPEEIASLGADNYPRHMELAFSRKQQEILIQMPQILDKMGIDPANHKVASDMIMGALDGAKRELVRKSQERYNSKKKNLDPKQIGNIMEHMQLLAPALSAVRYAQRMGLPVEIQEDGLGLGAYSTGLDADIISGKGRKTLQDVNNNNWSGFLRSRLPMSGFHLKIGGVDHFIVKEGRPSGTGDISHVVDPQGDAKVFPFEGKNNLGQGMQHPHLAQASFLHRFIMTVTRNAKSAKIGKVRTINTNYGLPGSETPMGTTKNFASCTTPRYGLARVGSFLDYGRMVRGFSVQDGPGLAPAGYE